MSPLSTYPPINVIYSGVAGTGKTYQLLQIAKRYTDSLPTIDNDIWLAQLLDDSSWREVICLVFLDLQSKQQDLVKVPEIVAHEFFVIKAAQNARDKNLNNTVWSVLQTHSSSASTTVNCDTRASQAYFDKDKSGAWYLLAQSHALLETLTQQLMEFRRLQQDSQSTTAQPMSHKRFSMASFHQAYGYEEFVEGIRPVLGADRQAQISYEVQDGAFLQLCQRATNDPDQRYAMLIDEINRANVTRVFGELLSLIEPDKRRGQPNAMQVKLAYSGRLFSVPTNIDIYATMNTQDHSLAPLDMALRRRFRFIDCPPQPNLLSTITMTLNTDNHQAHDNIKGTTAEHFEIQYSQESIDLAQLLSALNSRIIQTLGQEAQLGHAFLLSINDLAQLQAALVEQIIPQLAQAAGGQVGVLQYLFNDDQQSYAAQFIQDIQVPMSAEPSRFASHNTFGHQSMSAGGYVINPDLLARQGEFATATVYQRLY